MELAEVKTKKKHVVGVNYFLLSLTDINAAKGKFNADFYLDLHYYLSYDGKLKTNNIDWKKEWNPDIDFVNVDGSVTKSFENFIATEVTGRKDVTHKITYQTRISGRFKSQMNLRYFPFDSQRLQIHLESGEFMSDELDMRKEPGCGLNVSKDLREHGLVEWELNEVRDDTRVETLEFDGSTYSRFTVSCTVARRTAFYLFKIVLPFFCIVVMSMSVFGMPPEDVGKRVTVSITAALTATAFQLATASDLPKCSYLTSFDYFIMTSFFVIFMSCVANIVSFQFSELDLSDVSLAIDMSCLGLSALTMCITLIRFAWCGYIYQKREIEQNMNGIDFIPERKNSMRSVDGDDDDEKSSKVD